jgi:Ca2+-binding RTX toxin-like protein
VLTGKIGRDKLSGGAGADKISGNGGNDYLYGGSGNDKLTGGQGADDLWGGSGADTLLFKSIRETTVSGAGRDTIFDFSTKQKDKIDLSAIDARTTKGGKQAFSFIGTKAFDGKAGELRYEKAKSDTYIYGDVNGDRVADFTIHLDDRVSLSKSYFIL